MVECYSLLDMDLPNTLIAIARDPNVCAWRGRGVAIRVRSGLVVERVFVPVPYRWQPSFEDLIANDWTIGTGQQYVKQFGGEGA